MLPFNAPLRTARKQKKVSACYRLEQQPLPRLHCNIVPAMASLEAPLDEIQWRSPQIAASMQGVHSNSVLFYFAESPFYDRTSNNAVLMSQAMYNPNMFHIIQTREAFEGRLKTMSGLEFIVAQEPAEMAPGTGTGVWVIRKQTRRKRASEEDEITVHSTYYVVGENIYMAAAVSDILGNRMVIALGR